MREFVETTFDCRCGAVGVVVHVYRANHVLALSSSFRCNACGFALELDDDAIHSADLREAFYSANGCWALRIVELGEQRVSVMRKLREVLGLTAPQVIRVVKTEPLIGKATRTEMAALAEALVAVGARVEIVRIDGR